MFRDAKRKSTLNLKDANLNHRTCDIISNCSSISFLFKFNFFKLRTQCLPLKGKYNRSEAPCVVCLAIYLKITFLSYNIYLSHHPPLYLSCKARRSDFRGPIILSEFREEILFPQTSLEGCRSTKFTVTLFPVVELQLRERDESRSRNPDSVSSLSQVKHLLLEDRYLVTV